MKRAKARGLEAERQPGSGIYKDYPNDVVVETFVPGHGQLRLLGECKVRSRHPSYSEMQEWLDDVQANAKRTKQFAGAFLAYNVKGSRTPRILMDLDLLLNILVLTKQRN